MLDSRTPKPSTVVAISASTPLPLGSAAAGTSGQAADAGHVHAMPTAASVGALSASLLATNGDVPIRLDGVNTVMTTGATGRSSMAATSSAEGRAAIGAGVSNYVDPLTTRGDMLSHDGTVSVRVAKGAEGYVWRAGALDSAWVSMAAALAGMGTTQGMTLRRGVGAWEAVSIGTTGQVWTSDGTTAAWANPAGGSVTAAAIVDALADPDDASDVREALVPLTRTAVPDTAWTDAITGTAAVAHVANVHTLDVDSAGGVFTRRAVAGVVGLVPEAPEIELIGRFVITTGVPGSAHWNALSLGSADNANVVLAQAIETGQVQFWVVVTGSGTLRATSAGAVSLTSGESWIRLVVRPEYIAVYYGTGSGSTPPMSWTLVGSEATPPALLAGGFLTRIGLRTGRNSSGTGTYTTEWRNIQVRALGLAP